MQFNFLTLLAFVVAAAAVVVPAAAPFEMDTFTDFNCTERISTAGTCNGGCQPFADRHSFQSPCWGTGEIRTHDLLYCQTAGSRLEWLPLSHRVPPRRVISPPLLALAHAAGPRRKVPGGGKHCVTVYRQANCTGVSERYQVQNECTGVRTPDEFVLSYRCSALDIFGACPF